MRTKVIRACTLTPIECTICEETRAQIEVARRRIGELETENEALRTQLREVVKHDELQRADLERYRDLYERNKPNCPERVPTKELQLVFEQVVATYGDTAPANDASGSADGGAPSGDGTQPEAPVADAGAAAASNETPAPATTPDTKGAPDKRRDPHGRRRLDLTKLPVERVELDPDEVKATEGKGFVQIGEEVSDRVAFRPASYFRLRIVRRKWAPHEQADALLAEDDVAGADTTASSDTEAASSDAAIVEQQSEPAPAAVDAASEEEDEAPAVLVAPLPDSVWPGFMADPSAIAHVIVSKYDDVLPLHRQERISVRQGFALPRSTQCGWLGAAYDVCRRVVDAMFHEARADAFCIATDATGAPVRTKGACDNWHVFVFIADRDHVIFRYVREQTSLTVAALLHGFKGYLLSDAAPVYDVLHSGGDVIEVGCWFHARRYFWRALESDRQRSLEALAIIRELFKVDRECHDISMPARTKERARLARPVLAMFDKWVDTHRDHVDPRGPLEKAIGYYDNQRAALHRFLDDGRLRLDNNISEAALRNLVLGRHNWQWFAHETGLRWYTTFRSLIASCGLHGLNAHDYLEQLLRLAPHWPVTRMLQLAPKYWAKTIAGLDARQRAILVPPWETALAATEAPETSDRAA